MSFHIQAESTWKEGCLLTTGIQKDCTEGWGRSHTQQGVLKLPCLTDFSLFTLHFYFVAMKYNSSLFSVWCFYLYTFVHANCLAPGPAKTDCHHISNVCNACMHWTSNKDPSRENETRSSVHGIDSKKKKKRVPSYLKVTQMNAKLQTIFNAMKDMYKFL